MTPARPDWRAIAQAGIAKGLLKPASRPKQRRRVRYLARVGSALPLEVPASTSRAMLGNGKTVPVMLNRMQIVQEIERQFGIQVSKDRVSRAFQRGDLLRDGVDGKGNELVFARRLPELAQLLTPHVA